MLTYERQPRVNLGLVRPGKKYPFIVKPNNKIPKLKYSLLKRREVQLLKTKKE